MARGHSREKGDGSVSDVTTRDVLLKAVQILEPEGAWCQDAWARNAEGAYVTWNDPSAVARCCEAAILQASEELNSTVFPAEEAVQKVIGRHILPWNDNPTRTQAEVVSALRAAAEAQP